MQTSDAGTGVSTKREAGINSTCRSISGSQPRYDAPGDSRVHIAEKVMRSLNEHSEAGHTIPIPSVPLTRRIVGNEQE